MSQFVGIKSTVVYTLTRGIKTTTTLNLTNVHVRTCTYVLWEIEHTVRLNYTSPKLTCSQR